VKFELLRSTFDDDGSASARQHLACLVVEGRLAIDAGSLAMGATDAHRREIRDIVLTHAHLDHIAGLPPFIDDLYTTLTGPVRVHATREVIEVLEEHIFNWSVYPRFSELRNESGPVIEYREFERGNSFTAAGLTLTPVDVHHKVPATGFSVSDGASAVGVAGDTASLAGFQKFAAAGDRLDTLVVECAFPDEMHELAAVSHHMTPAILRRELELFDVLPPVMIVNIKPMYRARVVAQLNSLGIPGLEIMDVGRDYFW
jgi:cAMP phosphodiesterase